MLPRRVFVTPDTEVMAEAIRKEERFNFMIALVQGVRLKKMVSQEDSIEDVQRRCGNYARWRSGVRMVVALALARGACLVRRVSCAAGLFGFRCASVHGNTTTVVSWKFSRRFFQVSRPCESRTSQTMNKVIPVIKTRVRSPFRIITRLLLQVTYKHANYIIATFQK